MGLLDKLFPRKRDLSQELMKAQEFRLLTGYKPVFHDYYGSIYESALFRSAIEAKARHISKLKVELQGKAEFPLKTRLKYYPNDWMTWSQFMARCSTILDCTNNLFIVPVQNQYMETTGFFPVLPEKVTLVEDKEGTLWLKYKFLNREEGAVEFNRCAYLVKHQYKNDLFGESNRALRPTLDLISVQDEAIKEAVKNSATIKFVAQVDNFTSPEDLKKERNRFTDFNLKDETSELLLFPYQYKNIEQVNVQPFTIDDKQASLIKNNVFDYIGINEDIIQGSANSEKLDAFFNSSIEPFAIALAEALSRAIFTLDQRSYGNHVYVNANRLQYMTVNEKVNMAQQLGDRGALTLDEIRELFNYPPLPDGLGNVAVIRGEYYAIDEKLGQTVMQGQTTLEQAVNELEEGEENEQEIGENTQSNQ